MRRHDTLRGLAERFLNDEMRWPAIYRLNRDGIRHPDLIYVGQALRVFRIDTVPTAAPAAPAIPASAAPDTTGRRPMTLASRTR